MLKAKFKREEIEAAKFNLLVTAILTDKTSQQDIGKLNDVISSYNKILQGDSAVGKEDFVKKASSIFKDFTTKNPRFISKDKKVKPSLPNESLKDIL